MILHLDRKYSIDHFTLKGIKKRKNLKLRIYTDDKSVLDQFDQFVVSVMNTQDYKTDKTNYHVLFSGVNIIGKKVSLKDFAFVECEIEYQSATGSHDWSIIQKKVRNDRLKAILNI